jgi:hypothetical protein
VAAAVDESGVVAAAMLVPAGPAGPAGLAGPADDSDDVVGAGEVVASVVPCRADVVTARELTDEWGWPSPEQPPRARPAATARRVSPRVVRRYGWDMRPVCPATDRPVAVDGAATAASSPRHRIRTGQPPEMEPTISSGAAPAATADGRVAA